MAISSECQNDPEAAAELFKAVENWAREKGMAFLRGPLSPSMNYECGILIEGFEQAPTLMMTYNPPYYIDLIESNGFEKEKDLITIRFEERDQPSQRLERLVRRIRRNNKITIRPLNMRNLAEEMKLVNEIFRECWAGNWGFVPMTDEELRESVRDLPGIADPDLIFFPCYENEPVGVAMMLPDANPLLKRRTGKLGTAWACENSSLSKRNHGGSRHSIRHKRSLSEARSLDSLLGLRVPQVEGKGI